MKLFRIENVTSDKAKLKYWSIMIMATRSFKVVTQTKFILNNEESTISKHEDNDNITID